MKLLPVLSIIAVHALVQVHLIRRTMCPARDGARYFNYALRLEEKPWLQIIRSSVDHPGYPVLLHAALSAAKVLGVESPPARVRVAEGVSSLAGLCFALCAFGVVRRLWGDLPAWAGALCLVVLPRPAQTFADVLSDAPHALFWMASAGLVLRGIASRRARLFALAGVAGSMAYWMRVDAATLPAAVGVAALVELARRRLGGGLTLPSVGSYLAGFAVGLALFVAVCGKLTPKPVAEDFILGLEIHPAAGQLFLANAALPRSAAAPILSLWHLIKDLSQEVQFVHLVTAGAALALLICGRGKKAGATEGTTEGRGTGPGGIFAVAAVLACAAVVIAVDLRYGYLSGRYFVPVLPFIIGFGMHGMVELSRRWPVPAAGNWLLAGVILASWACSVPSLVKGRPREQAYGQLEAGRWVAQHLEEGDTVYDPYFFPAYLAGLRGRTTPSAVPPPGSRSHYLIAENRDLDRLEAARKLIDDKRAVKVAELPRREGGSDREVGVYRVRP